MSSPAQSDIQYMRLALRLARRGHGQTSPNPMVGALLVKAGRIIGQGWHHRAGELHAEIEALRDARARGADPRGATLYVSLEPCSTRGRTPPCTDAIKAAGIKCLVVAATDPNPAHAGRGFGILQRAGIIVRRGVLADEAARLNEAFNHWIVHHTPFVTVKAAMTLDGKIATPAGESKWITGPGARARGMKLRLGSDAILVGVNTILADNPSLTARPLPGLRLNGPGSKLRRVVLDSRARTPLASKIVSDRHAPFTTIVATAAAPARKLAALRRKVNVIIAPSRAGPVDLSWLLQKLDAESVTHLLVEGGGEVNASFLLEGLAQRIVFFYAPKVLGGREAPKAVAGDGAGNRNEIAGLSEIEWRKLGPDLMLTARVHSASRSA